MTHLQLSDTVEDGIPSSAPPLGLARMARYGIPHAILNLQLATGGIDWSRCAAS
jgi:hypothetical protein